MAAPQIPLFTGTVPSRIGQTKQEFSDNINDWVVYYEETIPAINTSVTFINDTSIATDLIAQSTASLANTIVSASNFKGEWGNLTGALAVPSTVFHDGVYWQLLIGVADVTLSEPTLVNTDWALSSQSADRVLVQSPFTLAISGRYHILGNGIITLPDPATLADGQVFNFTKEPNETPTIFVGTNLITTRLGLFDDYLFSISQTEFLVRSGLYQV